MSTRPTRNRKAVTRLEDEDLYEISFRDPGTRKTAKKRTISTSKRPSQRISKSAIESSSESSSDTSTQGTVATCRTAELIEGSAAGPIELDSDDDSTVDVTELLHALPSSDQESSTRAKVSKRLPPSDSILRRPIPKIIFNLYVRKNRKEWVKGFRQAIVNLDVPFDQIMEIFEKETVKHAGKAVRYPDQVNVSISTRWARNPKGIVLFGKKDPINVDAFCEFNELSLPALLGSIRASMKRNGDLGSHQLYAYAVIEDAMDTPSQRPENIDKDDEDDEIREVFGIATM